MANHENHDNHNNQQPSHSAHHLIDVGLCIKVGVALLVLTVVTVASARVDLGALNFPIAMLIATVKALLVIFFFMNQIREPAENRIIFFTSFLFLAIFIILTFADLFTRGDVYRGFTREGKVRTIAPVFKDIAGGGPSKFKKPWNSSPEIVAHGKALYDAQCTACHGVQGKGDGAAAAALNPKPRNFTLGDGWKNGRKPSQVFMTLTKGIPGSAMGAFATLSAEDRFALSHYVLAMGPAAGTDSAADLTAVGVDSSKESLGSDTKKSIPIGQVIKTMAVQEAAIANNMVTASLMSHAGRPIYEAKCASCHGAGAGGARMNGGLSPRNTILVEPLNSKSEAMTSLNGFARVVHAGLPGNLMPAHAELSEDQMSDLYSYIKGLSNQ